MSRPSSLPTTPPDGRVVLRQGPVLTVLTPTGERVPCLARGKGKGAVVGDYVHYVPTPPDELSSGNIMSIAPRRNFLARADEHARRPQVIAANLDRLVVVMAVQPPARSGLIDRLLVAAHAQGIPGCVVLNKTDLLDEISTEEMDEVLEPYPDLGYPVYRVSASTGDGMAGLAAELSTGTSIFVGHSGVGKTSLLNALCPGLGERVKALSEATGRGVHTTTAAGLFSLPSGGELIDCPGVRMFALWGVEPADLARHFVEFEKYAETCRFANCRHDQEPGCAVIKAVEKDKIHLARYDSYIKLRATLMGEELRGQDW
jgi:ribosome biogenesis GTPase